MPISRLLAILALAITAAALTVWLGVMLAGGSLHGGDGWLLVAPAAPLLYLLWRWIAQRLRPAGSRSHDPD